MGLVCSVLCSLAIGCGGGSGSIDIGDLRDSVLDAQCDHFVSCGVIESHDLCVQILSQGFSEDELIGAVNAGKVKYDGSLAAECLDAIRNESCDPSSEDDRVQPQACRDAIKGTVADGGACANSTECESGSCNTSNGTGTCPAGTCDPTQPAEVAIGQQCADSTGAQTVGCANGSYCDTATSHNCTALIASGQACTSSSQCDYGLVCAGATSETCQKPPQKAGDACLAVGSTTNLQCFVTGLYCDGTTMKCADYASSGGTCDDAHPCKFDFACGSTSMTCDAPPAAGDPCPTGQCAVANYCQFDAQTGNPTTCAALKANGTACTDSSECSSDNCDATTSQCADVQACF